MYHPQLYFPLVFFSPYGKEEGRRLETLWRFPEAQHCHSPKLDLQKEYYQVPVAIKDIQKTALINSFGMYEFIRMPFGLLNAGNTFQRMIDLVLGDLTFCFVYIDDILIFSRDLSFHEDNLQEIFLLCQKHGLTIGLPKCEFAVSKIELLGIFSPPLVALLLRSTPLPLSLSSTFRQACSPEVPGDVELL